jgi:hypothetical protein
VLIVYSFAKTLHKVTMPDSITVAEKTLVLNGMGTRTATLLKVKVYVMGLYLENKSSNPDEIIKSTQTKRVVQHYVRNVDVEKLKNGWKESFEKNNKDMSPIQKEYDQFVSYMVTLKKGDKIVMDFIDDRVEVEIQGKKKPPVKGVAFQKGLLKAWLGSNPTCPPLKKAILGK